MFRGLTRAEHRVAIGLILLLAAGAAWREFRRPTEFVPTITGPAIVHADGDLEPEAPPATELTRSSGVIADGTAHPALVEGRIDLNEASGALLETLPGIGPSKAEAILTYRQQAGGFASVDELLEVPGIGEKTLASLRDRIVINTPRAVATPVASASPPTAIAAAPVVVAPQVVDAPPPAAEALPVVRINSATVEEFETLAGIGPKLAERIVQDRARRGLFRNVEELTRVSGIGPKTMEKNRHRLAL